MYFAIWALIVGALLITMALSGTWLRRLPVSTAMLYLAAGFGLGPAGLALMAPDPLTYSGILESRPGEVCAPSGTPHPNAAGAKKARRVASPGLTS